MNIKKNKITYIFILSGLSLVFAIGLFLIVFSFSFELNGDKDLKISYKEVYEELGAKLSFFGKDLSKNVEIEGLVNSGEIGNYEIKYTYKVLFMNFNKTRYVSVVDLEKPKIELTGESVITICPNSKYQEEGYKAYDEIDGDLTDKVEIIEELSDIKYKVVDSNGNVEIVTREVKKEDKNAPVITLTGGSTITVEKGSVYKELGYKATDNCEGDLTKKVEVSGSVDTSKTQTFTITYTVEDSQGNKTTATRRVVVQERLDKAIPGTIYLTFDDGPSASGSTAKILDVLKKYNVKATFFIAGRGPDSLIKRAHDEGHVIALHTYTHDYKDIYSSINGYFNDLDKIKNRVKNLTGEDVTIIRFPGGSNNTVSNQYNYGIMQQLRSEVIVRGYSYFDWNVDASDAGQCSKSSVKDKKTCVYNSVTSSLSKKHVNMVLMHDTKSYTADALENIIKYAKNNSYEFKTITNTTSPVRFK